MARSRIFDLLQNYAFWLVDISPSKRFPYLVLGGPAYGFSEISHPEVTVQQAPINQLNCPYPSHVFQGATVAPVSMGRGVRFYDSSMWAWIDRYVRGHDVAHRDLLLIQHTSTSLLPVALGSSPVLQASNAAEILRVPGKAWVLWHCLPVGYKTGPGLDGKNSEITISELTVQPREFTEISADPSLATR